MNAPPFRVARVPGGPLTYLIDSGSRGVAARSAPATSPTPGPPRVEAACEIAMGHAPRLFRFLCAEATACSTSRSPMTMPAAGPLSVDQAAGMHTTYGLSLCLRLLALVDLLARASWLGRFYRLGRAGAALDPALGPRCRHHCRSLSQARFDERDFYARLEQFAELPRRSGVLLYRFVPNEPVLPTG